MLRKHTKKAVLILQTLKVDRARKGEGKERCVAQSGSGRRLLCCKEQRLF